MPSGLDSSDHPLRDVSTCVVLARGDDLPPGFLSSLERHGIDTLVIGHPLLAFAELLRLRRNARQRRTGLVVVNRDRWTNLEPVLRATRAHLPRTAIWIGSADVILEVSSPGGTSTGLRLIGSDEPAPPGRKPASPAEPPPASQPTPRSPEPADAAERKRSPVDTGVTPDEIEMLLRLFEEGDGGSAGPAGPDGPDREDRP